MYLVINKCVTAVKVSNFSGHYLRNRSTLDIGVLGYIGIVWHKENSPEVLHIPPGTPCILVDENRGVFNSASRPTYDESLLHPQLGPSTYVQCFFATCHKFILQPIQTSEEFTH